MWHSPESRSAVVTYRQVDNLTWFYSLHPVRARETPDQRLRHQTTLFRQALFERMASQAGRRED